MNTEMRLRPWLACMLIGMGSAVHAQSPRPVSAEELQEALAERDAFIIQLSSRLALLEQRLVEAGALAADASPTLPGMPSLPAEAKETTIASLAAERALEQSLVQRGTRLLPAGRFQLTPASAFAYAESGSAQARYRSEFQIHSLQARLGLPLDSQLDVSLPWREVKVRQTLQTGDQTIADASRTGNGLGDVAISLSKQLLSDRGSTPALVGRLNLQLGSGEQADNEVFLGGGFDAVGIDLSASWRKDPAVLFASAGFQRFQDNAGTRPGDSTRLSVGLGLALSPDTSLSFSLDQTLRRAFKSSGSRIDGSNQNATVFSVSSSSLLGRSALLQISAGLGLTPDAPDYQISVALPLASKMLWSTGM